MSRAPLYTLTLLGLLMATACPLLGQATATEKLLAKVNAVKSSSTQKAPPVFYWPSSARLPVKMKEKMVPFDGGKIVSRQLFFGTAIVDAGETSPFQFSYDTQRWNATFALEANPALNWGIAMFRKKDFLPGANIESMEGYLRGLKNREYTIEDSTLENPDVGVIVMGMVTQGVLYTTGDGMKHADHFFEYKGVLWSVGFVAPEKVFNTYYETVITQWAHLRFQ